MKSTFLTLTSNILPWILLWLQFGDAGSSQEVCFVNTTVNSSITEFLESHPSKGRFRIRGWQWHTMSLIRESNLLANVAATTSTESSALLCKATEYVVDFNMKGLHRVENELFFPWMREKLEAVENTTIRLAFLHVLEQVKSDQMKVSELGALMMDKATVLKSTCDYAQRHAVMKEVAELAESVTNICQNISRRADSIFVPVLTRLVPEPEQVAFNNKVLLRLGILNSRIHLVSMHQAVLERSEDEQTMFQEEIPYLPRYMIPRWKRLLYDPLAGILTSREGVQ